jgi:hypothetical protein
MISTRQSLPLLFALLLPALSHAQQPAAPPLGISASSVDIGATQPGSTLFDAATGTYRITGGGADLWGSEDQFRFDSVKLTGDATLTADVRFTSSGAIPLEKAVLMFRQSLDPASPYVDVAIHRDGHITIQYRLVPGGPTADVVSPDHTATRLRIERKGNLYTASTVSADGKATAFSSIVIPMDGSVYVGLGVCAHNAAGLTTIAFSNVSLSQPAGSPPPAKK